MGMTIEEHIGVIEDLKSTMSICMSEPEKTEICTSLSVAIDTMRQMEQKQRWIPASERLPEEDTDVLVTLKCGLIGIMQKKLADDDNGESCYIWQDFEGEEHEVIAWMPLPKPYKAESGEE